MNTLAIILIAFGLAMDAFAVSITCGISIRAPKVNNAFKIAVSFGLFQAIMPIIGWLAGLSLYGYIQSIDHWLAFCLLAFIGIRMIYEALRSTTCENITDPSQASTLLVLSVATSIDALAIGITFAFLNITIIEPVIIIGLITFALSLIGIVIGKKLGCYIGKRAEIVGGIVLVMIGVKILIEHLMAA